MSNMEREFSLTYDAYAQEPTMPYRKQVPNQVINRSNQVFKPLTAIGVISSFLFACYIYKHGGGR